jgi:hypothetical protein
MKESYRLASISPEPSKSLRLKVDQPGAKLNEAALEAVRQWRYEPVVDELGSPAETEITVTVNFTMPPEARPPK